MKTTKVTPVTVEEIQAVTAALNDLQGKMTFVQRLTPEQREQLPRLGPKGVQITGKRLEAARTHRDSLPPSFDFRQFERDAAVVVSLGECQSQLQRMLGDIRDTVQVLGPKALEASKAVFGYLQVAASGTGEVNTTVRSLKLRNRVSRKMAAAATSTTTVPAPPEPVAPVRTPDESKAA